jgi:hypothetical protein
MCLLVAWLTLDHEDGSIMFWNIRVVPDCEIDPISETLRFLIFRIPDDGQSPQTQQLSVL